MRWQRPCRIPPKSVSARYSGGTKIPDLSPFAGRPKVGSSQNRAASGPLSHPEKLPWPGIQGDRDTLLYPDGRQTKIWCLMAQSSVARSLGGLRHRYSGRLKFGVSQHGAVQRLPLLCPEKMALVRCLVGPRYWQSPRGQANQIWCPMAWSSARGGWAQEASQKHALPSIRLPSIQRDRDTVLHPDSCKLCPIYSAFGF